MGSIAKFRKPVQIFFSAVMFYIITAFSAGLWYIFAASIVIGALFGKTFCKWMCPMGLIMELMTKNMDSTQQKHHMYNYFKLGCPISWVQGIQNKYSLFKIKKDANMCVSCGLCDKQCYITTLNTDYSLYKVDKKNPAEAFNCSKCLECVQVCPKNSLSIKANL